MKNLLLKSSLVFILISLVSVSSSCSTTPPEIVKTNVQFVADQKVTAWLEWTKRVTVKICEDYDMEYIKQINIYVSNPEGFLTLTNEVIFISGYYLEPVKEINLWFRNPFGTMLTEDEYKELVLHEMLHHYYHFVNKTYPEDHNELFRKEIEDLGWHKYKTM